MQKLYIPESVKTRSEIFNGFGFTQLIQTIAITGVLGGVSFIIYLVHQSLSILITSILIICAASVTILTKDSTNQSVVDYSKNMIAFTKSQKKYDYYGREEIFK